MRSAQIRQIVNLQESNLLRELQSLQSDAETEVQEQLEMVQFAVSVMDSTLDEVSQSPSSDKRKTAKDVHDSTQKMLQSHVVSDQYHAPNYTFSPANIDALSADGQNFIGHVTEVEYPAGRAARFDYFRNNQLTQILDNRISMKVGRNQWRR